MRQPSDVPGSPVRDEELDRRACEVAQQAKVVATQCDKPEFDSLDPGAESKEPTLPIPPEFMPSFPMTH